jgi:hypothetical protein
MPSNAAFADHVRSGVWKVGAYGVDKSDAVLQDTDTEDSKDCYMVPLRDSRTDLLLHLLFELRAVLSRP